MFIAIETGVVNSPGSILHGKVIDIIPVTHDEFLKDYRNPFRKPNRNKAFRLDISKENSKTTVEVVSEEILSTYNVRYIKYPDPIIVGDLETDEEIGGLGYTVEGNTAVATSELNKSFHGDIVEKASILAQRDYRDGTLQAKVNLR
jgi:hypothetical protein